MESFLIVIPVDKFFNEVAQVLEILVLIGVDYFALKSFDEALAARIVIGITNGERCSISAPR